MSDGEKPALHVMPPTTALLAQGSREDIIRAYQELKEFTHTASHDLKAPLRHIVSYCEILRDDYGDGIGPAGRDHVMRLIVNARRLQRLVDDLLDYSQAADAAEEVRDVDVGGVAQEVLESLEEDIRESGARVTVEKLPWVRAYPLRIRQLLQNLISNALKYRGAEMPLILLRCEEEAQTYKFSVADNGIGIEDDHCVIIFEAFKRLHSRDEIEGSGLGLCICKKILDMHNGRIWVESVPGNGSTFYFTLPKDAGGAKL